MLQLGAETGVDIETLICKIRRQ